MDWEYIGLKHNIYELRQKQKNVSNTVFPVTCFNSEKEREQYALDVNKEFQAKTYSELTEKIAVYCLNRPYCQWCHRENISLIIEHVHSIKSKYTTKHAGKFRGHICMRCNGLEKFMKNKANNDKYIYLINKLKNNIYVEMTDIEFGDHIRKIIDYWYISKILL